ncbi:MAG: MerR family transcriptional regulator [Acidimicrobiia bacterium]|nr:MerR family transcriptional regulator [Acidimicrobiia bacterium]
MGRGETIEDLAVLTGVPASTIRMYQHIGILDPPQRQGRIGIYSSAHVKRIETILELKDLGFSLSGIRVLLNPEARTQLLTKTLGEGDPIAEPGSLVDGRVQFLSLLQSLDDEEGSLRRLFEGTSKGERLPVTQASIELARLAVGIGVPTDVILDEMRYLRDTADDLAQHYVELLKAEDFDRKLLDGFVSAQDRSEIADFWVVLLRQALSFAIERSLRRLLESD